MLLFIWKLTSIWLLIKQKVGGTVLLIVFTLVHEMNEIISN